MKTNVEQNNDITQPTEKKGSILYFFLIFMGFIIVLVGLSYAVKWLLA